MKQKYINLLIIIIIGLLTIFSCTEDLLQAEESLEGEWEVIEIISFYGKFYESGSDSISSVRETGQLGSFIFKLDVNGENNVDYNFKRNDTLFIETKSYLLDLTKVQSGFFKEKKFTLMIEDLYTYDVQFGNSTRYSEKNAKGMELLYWPNTGFGPGVRLVLEKIN